MSRAVDALRAVLPASTEVRVTGDDGAELGVRVAGRRLRVAWAGEGWTGDVRAVLSRRARVDVVAARRLSPGARHLLNEAGVGWVDELGNAEISIGSLVVSRTGSPDVPVAAPLRWTPGFVSVAEAVLCGIEPTVAATTAATGLSTGTCTNALRTLTDLGFLTAGAARGRSAGRRIVDRSALLGGYAEAAAALASTDELAVGVTWRDPLRGLAELAPRLLSRKVRWAATGATAAAVMAPFLTTIATTVVYVDAATVPALQLVARSLDLKPIEGGRLVLRPAPIGWTDSSRSLIDGIYVAPWPRVYVDLRGLGVRGEDAAAHLADTYLTETYLTEAHP